MLISLWMSRRPTRQTHELIYWYFCGMAAGRRTAGSSGEAPQVRRTSKTHNLIRGALLARRQPRFTLRGPKLHAPPTRHTRSNPRHFSLLRTPLPATISRSFKAEQRPCRTVPTMSHSAILKWFNKYQSLNDCIRHGHSGRSNLTIDSSNIRSTARSWAVIWGIPGPPSCRRSAECSSSNLMISAKFFFSLSLSPREFPNRDICSGSISKLPGPTYVHFVFVRIEQELNGVNGTRSKSDMKGRVPEEIRFVKTTTMLQ